MKTKNKILSLLLYGAIFTSCGKSIFSSLDKKDAAVDASIELEDANPQGAINILLSELGDNFTTLYESLDGADDKTVVLTQLIDEINSQVNDGKTNVPNLVSILSSAKAQLHGVDPFRIALKFVETSTSTDSNNNSNNSPNSQLAPSNELTALFPVLPEATDSNINGLDTALILLASLDEHRTTAEEYKRALLLTASIALSTKALDSDGDGKISALEAITLPSAVADALISQITAAATTAANGQDGENSVSTEQIINIKNQIDQQEGATQEEKLKNFIANNQSSGS